MGKGLLGIFVVLLLTAGCMSPRPSPAAEISATLTRFHSHLVFARYDQAALFLKKELQLPFVDYYEAQGSDFKVVEFEVARVELSDDEERATVQVDLSWHQLPSMTIQRSRLVEEWVWDSMGERWWVESQEVRDLEEERAENAHTGPHLVQ